MCCGRLGCTGSSFTFFRPNVKLKAALAPLDSAGGPDGRSVSGGLSNGSSRTLNRCMAIWMDAGRRETLSDDRRVQLLWLLGETDAPAYPSHRLALPSRRIAGGLGATGHCHSRRHRGSRTAADHPGKRICRSGGSRRTGGNPRPGDRLPGGRPVQGGRPGKEGRCPLPDRAGQFPGSRAAGARCGAGGARETRQRFATARAHARAGQDRCGFACIAG